jgi:hypothetical protein
MPLVKASLKAAIQSALDTEATKTSEQDDPAKSRERIAGAIADAVHQFILSATITVTGVSPSGPVTGTGIIS